MKIDRALVKKFAPYGAAAVAFVAGALAVSPLAAQQPDNSTAAQPVQLAQASIPRAAPTSQAQVQLSFAPVASRAEPAVVNVYAQRVVRGLAQDPFFGRFRTAPRTQLSLGSGVIVRSEGIVVTNHHVVEGAQSLKVVLSDRREFDAELLLDDERVDLAVLRIRPPNNERLPTLNFANTSRTQVGDLVLAIGNPFGLSETVTSGIISALARTEVGVSDYAFFIQTDAAINRGNSGGALVDMNGDLVGINTAIFSEQGGSNGIGFAIPAEMVRRVVESAASGGRTVVRPWLGVSTQPVTQDIARSLGLQRPEGVIVRQIYPNSAGARAGLQAGDVILTVDGAEVHDEGGLRYQFATQRPGTRVNLDILRSGARRTISANAEAPPGGSPEARELAGRNPLSGARVVTLTPATAETSGLDPFATGVFIQALDRGGIAAGVGFRPGDIIETVNGRRIASAAELEQAMNAVNRWQIGVRRGEQRATLSFGG